MLGLMISSAIPVGEHIHPSLKTQVCRAPRVAMCGA
jgi:hypothetical protein